MWKIPDLFCSQPILEQVRLSWPRIIIQANHSHNNTIYVNSLLELQCFMFRISLSLNFKNIKVRMPRRKLNLQRLLNGIQCICIKSFHANPVSCAFLQRHATTSSIVKHKNDSDEGTNLTKALYQDDECKHYLYPRQHNTTYMYHNFLWTSNQWTFFGSDLSQIATEWSIKMTLTRRKKINLPKALWQHDSF